MLIKNYLFSICSKLACGGKIAEFEELSFKEPGLALLTDGTQRYQGRDYSALNSSLTRSSRSSRETLSKNITMVLENLLKNYESSQPPNHAFGNRL